MRPAAFNETGLRLLPKTGPKNDRFTTTLHGAMAIANSRDDSSQMSGRGGDLGSIDGIQLFAVAVLNRLTQGVIFVDAKSRPFFVNRAAERIAAESDGLTVGACGLTTAGWAETLKLRRMISAAANGEIGFASRCALNVRRPSQRRSYALLVAPLHSTSGAFLAQRSGAIVFVWDPERAAPDPSSYLRQLYGLTAGEAALTIGIMHGGGLKAAADALGIALTTARTHLRNVFQKTQTHRQAELVRLIAEMQMGLAFDCLLR
jgi:DNA-binding CsgD family transcriptional regulator